RVGPLPLAHETVRRLGVLLDVVRNERKAGLGPIRLDIERLPHALALLRPDLKEAGEMRSHDALEGDGPRGRANLRQALAPRRRWSPAAVDENELVAAGHAQRHDYLVACAAVAHLVVEKHHVLRQKGACHGCALLAVRCSPLLFCAAGLPVATG